MSDMRESRRFLPNLVLVAVCFIATRILIYILGIRFDTVPLAWFFQILDPYYLRTDLARSIFYMHSQPPGFNILIGVVLKISPNHATLAFHSIYCVIGLFMALLLYVLLIRLHVSHCLAFLCVLFFMMSPPVIFFENWLFYTYPVAFLLLASAFFLATYLECAKLVYCFFFFCTLALIVMTRSMFHPLWFVLIVIGLALALKKQARAIIGCAILPFLVIAVLCCKNYIVFKQTMLSSWFGMNLIKMTFTVPLEKIAPLIEDGEVSDIAVIKPFSNPEVYKQYANFDTVTGIPVLDEKYKSTGGVNFNHIGYRTVSEKYYRAACTLIRRYPQYYGLSVVKAFYAFLRPSSDISIISGDNRQHLEAWVAVYQDYILGDALRHLWQTKVTNRFGETRTAHINFLYLFIPLIILWAIFLSLRGRKSLGFTRNTIILINYFLFNIIYITFVGNMTEASENMRFRFTFTPFMYIFCAMFVMHVVRNRRKT